MKTRLLTTFTCAALAAFSHPADAAPGDLDLTFGGTGKVTTAVGSSSNGHSVAVQADGKIVVAGDSRINGTPQFALVRYNANGSLDTSFGGTGKVTTAVGNREDFAYGVAIQSDGKIVAAGYSNNGFGIDFALVRYNVNGSLDTSFGGTGKVITHFGENAGGQTVAVQNDGKIVVAGWSSNGNDEDFALVRYNVNGSLDTSFGGTGAVTTDFAGANDIGNSVAVQGDGKIVVAGPSGSNSALVRYNTDGSLDTSFGGTGKVTTAFGGNSYFERVAAQADGKIVVAGDSRINGTPQFALVRYNTDGSLDTAFGGTGKVTTPVGLGDNGGRSVAVQVDGKIVAAGYSSDGTNYDFTLVRYNTDGSLDTGFGGTGKVTTDLGSNADVGESVLVQNDGRIVVAGYSNTGINKNIIALTRYEGGQLIVSAPQAVNLGSQVTFTVATSGVIPLSYQWRKDGVDIPGATASSYIILNTQPWHIGDYTVVATYAGGTALSGVALLQINGIPTSVWRGLLAYFPFDGNALDLEAGGSHATVSGATLTTDRLRQTNRAFDFDGINDQMTATVPNLPIGSAPRTISLWAKARPDPSRGVGLVEWGLAQNGRSFGIANGGSPYTWNGKTYGAGNGVNSGVLVDSKWHHVCLTYEGGLLSVFLDGVLKQTKSEAIDTGLSALTMGVGVEGSTFYPGSLDEVRIYNRALSASEVQQLVLSEDPDTDGDGIRDRFETGTGVYVSAEDTGTSPTNPDSDDDGLNDGDELNAYQTNPTVRDTDGDGFDDGFEVTTGFSPTSAVSTPDALSSIRTAAEYRFNAANGVSYRIEASTDLATWTTIETNIIGAGGSITRFYPIEGQARRYFRSRRN